MFANECGEKIKYASHVEASAASKRNKTFFGELFNPYKCMHCDGFHIGHREGVSAPSFPRPDPNRKDRKKFRP